MRLAYCVRAIFPQHGYGGLERSGSALMRHLLAGGVDVALFTRPLPIGQPFRPPAESKSRLTVHTVRYGRLPLRHNGIPARLTNYRAFVEDMGRKVKGLALKGYIEGIYAHGLCVWGVRHAAGWGMPMLANPHGMEEFKVRDPLKRLAYAPFRAWVRAGCRAADRVIATDQAMRGEVAALLKIDPEKVAVIPNGVDVDEALAYISPQVRADLVRHWPLLAASDASVRGISVGRLEANKGFEYLLRALSLASGALDGEWTWVVVGEGSLEAHLRALTAELGLDGHVFFTGRVSDEELHNLYAMSNLFVHPTLYEGSSLVTLEAMAHGLPVIASAVGGIPDKVIEGATGSLVRAGDPDEIASRIIWMLAHPAERARMGAQAARLARERFGWRRIAAQTIALFEEVLAEKAACHAQEVV